MAKTFRKSVSYIENAEETERLNREIALDYFITAGNQTAAYSLYQRLQRGEGYTATASAKATASTWFKTKIVADYIENRKHDVFDKLTNELKDYTPKKKRSMMELSTDEIRQMNLEELTDLKNITQDPMAKAAIIKQITELMDAKLKNTDISTSNTDTLIHFYLPYAACDNCPHSPIKATEDEA